MAALGGGWPTDHLASPAVMAIDYVKVFKDKTLPEAASTP